MEHVPGPSLPKLMAQLALSKPVSVEHVPGSSLPKLMAQLAQKSIVVLQGSANSYFVFANNVPVIEYIRDSYMTQACHRIRLVQLLMYALYSPDAQFDRDS